MGFQFDIFFLWHELAVGVKTLPVVLLLSVVPLVIGLILGTGIGVARFFRMPGLHQPLAAVVVFLRGVPLVLQLIILYLAVNLAAQPLAQQLGSTLAAKDISYTAVAVAGLSIHAAVYLSEVVRTALNAVPAGQYEAAYAAGLTFGQTLRRIILPQALPVAVPLIGSQFIGLIKGSSVASLISVVELINAAMFEASSNYKFLEAYLAVAILYWGLCFAVERLTALAETRVGSYGKGGIL